MKMNTSKYGFSFFLSGRVPVTNLEQAAKQYGGATHNYDTDEMFSNIPGGEFIQLRSGKQLNTLSVFIPSTDGTYAAADNEKIKRVISTIISKVYKRYEAVPTIEKGIGSWQADDGGIAYDHLTITSVHIETVTETDIRFFVRLGLYIKRELKQEAVTITINDALALV
jgi:hypothetical protein